LAGKTFALEEEYIAGWLSMFPATHLTPCVGVHSVPPSSFVLLGPGKHAVSKYWDFDPNSKIRYKTDAEYEEHFRTVFATAVQRRLRSDSPVLAELSGGRDSSSIVCMADKIIAQDRTEKPRMDTISYYDDSEPNWNERPYFTKVEAKRGRTGWHVNLNPQAGSDESEPSLGITWDSFVPNPGSNGCASRQIKKCLRAHGYRVMLSGIGGDEVMGGVPAPEPELEDFLAKARLGNLADLLEVWALESRRPWFHLLWNAARRFFPPSVVGVPKHMKPIPWLKPEFVKHQWSALTGYPCRIRLFGALPSFQENLSTLDALRRQLACIPLPLQPLHEKRYPYLDRSLLEFIFAIPREQLIRPHQRRSLMRRALTDVVPHEVLNRKMKAFVVRSPLVEMSADWNRLREMTRNMVSSRVEIVSSECFYATLQKARHGEVCRMVPLIRTIQIENYLTILSASRVVSLKGSSIATPDIPDSNTSLHRTSPECCLEQTDKQCKEWSEQ
jgi:asparagine synthase (glutamine-hydrolysing)